MYKFKLDFETIPQVGIIEVAEPFGFDEFSHSISRDNDNFGRDVILGSENVDLVFTRAEFERFEGELTLIDGTRTNYLNHAFDYLLDLIKTHGWEAKARFIVEYESTEFTVGYIDFYTAKIDYDSISFTVIQRNLFEKIKRSQDVVINAFSSEDLEGNPIQPCQTVDILLKAKPIVQISEWKSALSQDVFSQGNTIAPGFFNGINQVTRSEIADTLTWAFLGTTAPIPTLDYETPPQDFRLLRAETRLTNLSVELKLNMKTQSVNVGNCQVLGFFAKGSSMNDTFSEFRDSIDNNGVQFYDSGVISSTSQVYERNDTVVINLPYTLEIGEILYMVFLHAGTTISKNTFLDCTTTVTATSTSISTKTKGVRLIDFMKHNIRSVGGVDLIAPIYDVGGEHYDNFVFSGYMLGNISDKPLNYTYKDLQNIPKEICGGFQINENNVECLPYEGYYSNTEIGSFKQKADTQTNQSFNDRYFLKTIDFSYKKSSKGRETNTKNTIDDVHGTTQWLYPSERTENNLKIEINHIRSAFLGENQRRQQQDVNNTNSLSNDTDLFVYKCVQITPNTQDSFSAVLTQQFADGRLKILSNNFNWLNLPMANPITITRDGVSYVHIVESVEPNVITLFSSAGNDVSGTFSMTISYTIAGVQYVNQTNQGFETIEGIESPENYSNLLYSVKRNLNRWKKYLMTAGSYLIGKEIKNTQFDNNGNLFTKLFSESEGIDDNDPILIDENKLITPVIHEITVLSNLDEATQLFKDIRDIKGFVRVETLDGRVVKGYPRKSDFTWVSGELDFELEEKFEMSEIAIRREGNTIYVNETGYNEKIGLFWFRINGIYVSLYDEQNVKLANTDRWENVSINGVKYITEVAFSDALTQILN